MSKVNPYLALLTNRNSFLANGCSPAILLLESHLRRGTVNYGICFRATTVNSVDLTGQGETGWGICCDYCQRHCKLWRMPSSDHCYSVDLTGEFEKGWGHMLWELTKALLQLANLLPYYPTDNSQQSPAVIATNIVQYTHCTPNTISNNWKSEINQKTCAIQLPCKGTLGSVTKQPLPIRTTSKISISKIGCYESCGLATCA